MTSETPLSRRRLLQSGVTLGSLALAGCSGGGSSTPTTKPSILNGNRTTSTQSGPGTETTTEYEPVDEANPTVTMGEIVGDEDLAFAVQGLRRQEKIGEQSAPEGREYAFLQMGIRNRTTGEYISFANMRVHLVDGNGKKHDRISLRGDLGAEVAREQLAPGELARTVLAFTVPTDATNLSAFFEFDMPGRSFDTVTVDLTETSRPIATFEQDLDVKFWDVGETVSDKGLSVTLDGVRTADSLDGAGAAGDQQEYLIPKVTVENTTGDSVVVVFTEDAGIKDGNGNSFAMSVSGLSALENPLPESREIRGKKTLEGELAYVVPKGLNPLYFVFDFSLPVEGFRRFWQIR